MMHFNPTFTVALLLANLAQRPTEELSTILNNAFSPMANSEEGTGEQSSHATHLGNTPETLENRQPSIMWRGQGPPPGASDMTTPTRTTEANSQKKETMIYRGKLFETQYFGPTHSISWGARVCLIPPPASIPVI